MAVRFFCNVLCETNTLRERASPQWCSRTLQTVLRVHHAEARHANDSGVTRANLGLKHSSIVAGLAAEKAITSPLGTVIHTVGKPKDRSRLTRKVNNTRGLRQRYTKSSLVRFHESG